MSNLRQRIAARRARARALNDLYAEAHGPSRLDMLDGLTSRVTAVEGQVTEIREHLGLTG